MTLNDLTTLLGLFTGKNTESCAASPWNYDMSQAPRDGLAIIGLWKGGMDWSKIAWNENLEAWQTNEEPDEIYDDSYFRAFATINFLEQKKD